MVRHCVARITGQAEMGEGGKGEGARPGTDTAIVLDKSFALYVIGGRYLDFVAM